MSQGTTLVLLPQTGYPGVAGAQATLVSVAQRGASYYLTNSNQQTISWSLGQILQPSGQATGLIFQGDIEIQASLSSVPTSDQDWFHAAVIDTTPTDVTNVQSGFMNLYGNYVWLRVKVTNWTQGAITLITVSY